MIISAYPSSLIVLRPPIHNLSFTISAVSFIVWLMWALILRTISDLGNRWPPLYYQL